ncbi:MAG TPA: tetratricopeptide repeat protein [Candidatus Binataceae bacterium]|nr:tetratricopeptide repeat protein [Candidatus Binataceae bacterium]
MESRADFKNDYRIWLAMLLAATALLYIRDLGFGFITDDGFWLRNPYIRSWSFAWYSLIHDSWWFHNPYNLPQSPYYRPMQGALATALYHLFGASSVAWHGTMIALYLIVVWMVFRVAALLCGDRWIALLAAALYALMPMHAQSVIWSTVIDMPMNAAFQLAAFEFYLHRAAAHLSDKRRGQWLALSLGFFACALLSYDSAVTFPALVAVHVLLFGADAVDGRETNFVQRTRAAMAEIWPYVLVTIAYLGLRFWMMGFISRTFTDNPMTAGEMLLTLPAAIWYYAILLVLPWLAMPAHHLATVRSAAEAGFLLPSAGLIILCGGAFIALRRHPHRSLYLFCIAWVLFALAPALDLRALQAGIEIADRYLYFPSFGYCVMVADVAMTFGRKNERKMNLVRIGTAAAIALYAGVLLWQEGYWRDNVAYFSGCIAGAPSVALWHNQLARVLEERGDLSGARQEFVAAAALEPNNPTHLHFLGLIDQRLGDPRAAVREMSDAIKLLEQPFPDAYAELAMAKDAAGDSHGAEEDLRRAGAISGGAKVAGLARAQLNFRHGNFKDAEVSLSELLREDPGNLAALKVLGAVLLAEHRDEEALATFRRAAPFEPYDPALHYRIALTLHQLGRDREAHSECAIAIAGAPDDTKYGTLCAEIEQKITSP